MLIPAESFCLVEDFGNYTDIYNSTMSEKALTASLANHNLSHVYLLVPVVSRSYYGNAAISSGIVFRLQIRSSDAIV